MQTPAPSGVVLCHSSQVAHEVKDGGERGADLVRVNGEECKARAVKESSEILWKWKRKGVLLVCDTESKPRTMSR